MATNIDFKIAQGLTLQGALFIEIGDALAFAPLDYEVQGNNVKFTFGAPFSFTVESGSTITSLKVRDVHKNEVLFDETLNITVATHDVVFIDEVSFTLLED